MGLMDLVTGALGIKNEFKPQAAELQDSGAIKQIGGAQQRTSDILGQQQSLAALLGARANQANVNYGGAAVDQNAGNIQDVTGGYQPAGIDYGAANQTGASLQDLIGQVRGVAAGTGPNPAQEQFRQNIGQAIQQQAGTVASTRGLNPALAARLASQGGASMMQGAAGQAAALQAQQQLGAQSLAGGLTAGLQQQQAGQAQAQAQLAAQQRQFLTGTQQQTAAQQAQLRAGLNTSQAQLATQQAAQQAAIQQQYAGLGAGLLGTVGGQSLQQQQTLQAAIANLNAQRVAQQGNLNQVGAGVAGQNAATGAGLLGGLLQGGGSMLSLAGLFAKGGEVPPKMADGGVLGVLTGDSDQRIGLTDWTSAPPPRPPPGTMDPTAPAKKAADTNPVSSLGKSLQQAGQSGEDQLRRFSSTGTPSAPWVLGAQSFADGGEADAPVGAGLDDRPIPQVDPAAAGVARQVAEGLAQLDPKAAAVVYADLLGIPTSNTPEDVRAAFHLLALHNAALLSQRPASPAVLARQPAPAATDTVPLRRALGGRTPTFARAGRVPGKAEVAGDSERNDKVPAMLSPGEIVVPRTVAQAPDAPRRAADFVAHLVAKKRRGFGNVAAARERP